MAVRVLGLCVGLPVMDRRAVRLGHLYNYWILTGIYKF